MIKLLTSLVAVLTVTSIQSHTSLDQLSRLMNEGRLAEVSDVIYLRQVISSSFVKKENKRLTPHDKINKSDLYNELNIWSKKPLEKVGSTLIENEFFILRDSLLSIYRIRPPTFYTHKNEIDIFI